MALASLNVECKNFALTLKSTNINGNNDDYEVNEEKRDIDESTQMNSSLDAQSSKGIYEICYSQFFIVESNLILSFCLKYLSFLGYDFHIMKSFFDSIN